MKWDFKMVLIVEWS